MRTLTLTLTLTAGLLLAISVSVATPAPLAAQECEKCQDESETGPHKFTEDGDGAFLECFSCHFNSLSGTCSPTHGPCGGGGSEDLDALAAALETAQLSEVRTALDRFTDPRINLAAGAVDIYCGDQVTARVDVPRHAIPWLTGAEPFVSALVGS